MNAYLLIAAIFIGSIALAVSAIFVDGFRQGLSLGEIIDYGSTQNAPADKPAPTVKPNDPEDLKLRKDIALSYCNVQRSEGKIQIDGFDECLTQYSSHPIEIYKSFTGEQIIQNWNSLAASEKALVVSEVKVAEQEIYAYMEEKVRIEANNESIKKMNDYYQCQSDKVEDASKWLAQKCPTTTGFFFDSDCRFEAAKSAEYKSLFGCGSPF